MRNILILLALSTTGFGEGWSGVLVDAKCYDSMERNVNPFEPYVDHELDARYCRPSAHTKLFAILQDDWTLVKLHPAANTQVMDLVHQARKKVFIGARVTGELQKDTVRVDSISPASNQQPPEATGSQSAQPDQPDRRR